MRKTFIMPAQVDGRVISVYLSKRAMKGLHERDSPLHVSMELYFSTLVFKVVRFGDASVDMNAARVTSKLYTSFRPVHNKVMRIGDITDDNKPMIVEMPVVKKKNIVPRHLFIDYKRGEWLGSFTWNL